LGVPVFIFSDYVSCQEKNNDARNNGKINYGYHKLPPESILICNQPILKIQQFEGNKPENGKTPGNSINKVQKNKKYQ